MVMFVDPLRLIAPLISPRVPAPQCPAACESRGAAIKRAPRTGGGEKGVDGGAAARLAEQGHASRIAPERCTRAVA